jgi:hypothetical protein
MIIIPTLGVNLHIPKANNVSGIVTDNMKIKVSENYCRVALDIPPFLLMDFFFGM